MIVSIVSTLLVLLSLAVVCTFVSVCPVYHCRVEISCWRVWRLWDLEFSI